MGSKFAWSYPTYLPRTPCSFQQTAKDQGWNSALSIGIKDKQLTIASFSTCLTGKDYYDDDEQPEQKCY